MKIRELKETALYVDDLARAGEFYRDVLRLPALAADGRFQAFDVNGRQILLLFRRGASVEATALPGGLIPGHDGAGPVHAGFAVEADELDAWEAHLARHGVRVESRMTWPGGGRSVYFRDPDGHLLELLTPGVWATY